MRTFWYFLPKASETKLEIYNILGEKILTLFNGKKDAVVHKLRWEE